MKHVAKLAASWAVDVVLPAKYVNALAEALAADRAELEAMALEWAIIAVTAREDALNRHDVAMRAVLAREAIVYEACAAQMRKHLEGNDD